MKNVFALIESASILVAAMMGTIGSAHAQECTDLARVISREAEKYGTASQIQMENKAQLCSIEYEKSSGQERAQIEAAFGILSGGLGGSSTQIHQLQAQKCEGHYGTHWYGQVTDTELRRVSDIGAKVVEQCLEAKDFKLIGLTIQNESLTASFRYGGQNKTTINGVIITPPDAAKCLLMFNGNRETNLSRVIGQRISGNDTISLVCVRQPDASSSTKDQKHYHGGILGISTTSDTSILPIIDYSVPSLPEPVADAMKADIQRIHRELDAIHAKQAVVSSQDFYRCSDFEPGHGQGSLGGGSWGFYGCQGQVTTQAFCSVIEYPHRQNYPCQKIGKLRIAQ